MMMMVMIMCIYHALIDALSAHMIHINLHMIFYTHVEHSPTKTIYIKYYANKMSADFSQAGPETSGGNIKSSSSSMERQGSRRDQKIKRS